MKTNEELVQVIISQLDDILADGSAELTAASPLIGGKSKVTSNELVELLLAMEEFAEDEMGVVFDWTSDATMSEQRGILRSINALAAALCALQNAAAAGDSATKADAMTELA